MAEPTLEPNTHAWRTMRVRPVQLGSFSRMANTWAIWLIVAMLAAISVLLVPTFLNTSNVLAILANASVLAITALGVTFVVTVGEIDVSVGGTATAAALVATGIMNGHDSRIPLAVLAVIMVGALIGLVNGALVALGVQSFILTLAVQIALLGAIQIYSGGITLGNVASAYSEFFLTRRLGIPAAVLCLLATLVITYFVQEGTRLGHRVRVVGGNREAARLSGVNVFGTIVACFVISGTLAAAAGLVYLGFIGPPSDFSGMGLEFEALAAVVIGGAASAAGRGSVMGTLAGVVVLSMTVSLLVRLGLPYGAQLVTEGGVIVAIGAAYALLRRNSW